MRMKKEKKKGACAQTGPTHMGLGYENTQFKYNLDSGTKPCLRFGIAQRTMEKECFTCRTRMGGNT